ncbi:alpha-(1,3)-fucosyltransferase 10 [Trichonephila clavata]|uniref:Fucosyltransferase n=1 Tax=Trichonephila clavata TaxID=2740835 RepID=A0A8X6FF56_TRICU|nr:alpha-(1,3)-fucosyltransferase 10 [Trichonephila clavata]
MIRRLWRSCCKRRGFRYKVALIIVGIVFLFYLLIIIFNVIESNLDEGNPFFTIHQGEPVEEKLPIIIWWTPFTGDSGSYKQCGQHICYFTDQRKYVTDPRTKAFLFYGSDFKPTDLPLPRSLTHDWGLLHEESPKNNFLFSMERIMKYFNHTATFRRESDLPLTFQYLESLESLTSQKYFVPTSVKNEKGKTLAPLVYLHSDCNTPSERDSYVEELAKYIPVDSYGKCLQNKELPPHLSDPLSNMISPELFQLLAQYKFNLAFENAVCQDYITEKLWRPLTIGSVPIYYGSPKIEDWLPNPKSAILVKNFESPKQLAEHLLALLADDSAYEEYLEHMIRSQISNKRLIEAMANREWGINNDPAKKSFIDCFECLVCKRVAENFKRELRQATPLKFQATFEHYGCPKPGSNFSLKEDSQNWWPELYDKAVFEARALENLIRRGTNYTSTDFYQEVINLLENSAVR